MRRAPAAVGPAAAQAPFAAAGAVTGAASLVVAAIVLALAVASCAAGQATPPPPVTGIVLSVDSNGLGDVRAFTLRDAAGHSWTFTIGQLENAAQFPPGHLGDHRITAEPVTVWYRLAGGADVAYRIEDAGGPASTSTSNAGPS